MKRLLLILLLTGCVSNPKGELAGDRVAVTIEGLGSIQYVKSEYTKNLKALGYTVYNLTHTYNKPIVADVCIGHSFGGGRLMRNDVKCKLVITLDAREWNASNNDSYVSEHAKHFNLYQTSGLRGYVIVGAVNKEIKNCSHTRMPKCVTVEIMDILNKQ